MPDQCARSGAGVQLVELVLSGNQAGRQDGGHYESSTASHRCRPSHQTCRTDYAVPQAYASCKRQAARAYRQYPRGFESCEGSCGAVASNGSLEDLSGLRGGQNHPPAAALAPARSACDGRVTAGFRINKVIGPRSRIAQESLGIDQKNSLQINHSQETKLPKASNRAVMASRRTA